MLNRKDVDDNCLRKLPLIDGINNHMTMTKESLSVYYKVYL